MRKKELFANFLAQDGGSLLSPREEKVAKMVVDGKSYEEIGIEFDVTRERVRQIADKATRKIATIMQQHVAQQRLEEMMKGGVKSLSISDLNISIRAEYALLNAGITHASQLADFTEPQMLRIKKFGKKYLNELKDLGIRFKGTGPTLAELTVGQQSDLSTVVAGIKKLGEEEAREVSLCLLTLLLPFAINSEEATNLLRHFRDRLLSE